MNTQGACNHNVLVNLSLFGHLGKAGAAVTTAVTEAEVWKQREKNAGRQGANKTTEGGRIQHRDRQ